MNHTPFTKQATGVPALCLVSIRLPKGKLYCSVELVTNTRPTRVEAGLLRDGVMHWFTSAMTPDRVLLHSFTAFVKEGDILQVYRMGSSATEVRGLVTHLVL
jgi:hypothetical protein